MTVSLVKITPDTIVYTVGHNTAGYSPDPESVFVTVTLDDARAILADELDELADDLGNVESDCANEDGEDFELSNYAYAIQEIVKNDRDGDIAAQVSAGGWTTYIDTGRSIDTAYWIHKTTLADAFDGDTESDEYLEVIDTLLGR